MEPATKQDFYKEIDSRDFGKTERIALIRAFHCDLYLHFTLSKNCSESNRLCPRTNIQEFYLPFTKKISRVDLKRHGLL